jgi:hypothetical protein
MHQRRAGSSRQSLRRKTRPVTASPSRTHCSILPLFTCAAAMLICLCIGSSATAGDPPQSPKPHSLIHRETPENAQPAAGPTTAVPESATRPSSATRPTPKKLTKRPADSSMAGQSPVTTTSPTPGSIPSAAPRVQPSKSATETRGSVAVTALAASGTSVLSTAPLASGGAGTASAAPAAPSAAKAPLAGALAGVSAVPSAAPGGTAAGRGLQRLAAQLPGLTELIAPTVSISTPLPSPGNPSSDPSTSQPPPSPPPSTTTPPPSAPAPGRGSATLSWTLNSETDLAGYKIYVGTAPGRYTYTGSPFTIGVTGTYTIAGLPSGQTYYFAVSAYDYFGAESGLSSEVSKSIY